VQIKQAKTGPQLARRRKRARHAREAWVVLTDLAHNLLAGSRAWFGRARRSSLRAACGEWRVFC
jgi:hypothetical protein